MLICYVGAGYSTVDSEGYSKYSSSISSYPLYISFSFTVADEDQMGEDFVGPHAPHIQLL